MTTRRELLDSTAAALAGLAFVGCGLTLDAAAQPAPRRREVVVNSKRVRTIDCHAHCHVPEALALMGLKETYPALAVSADRIQVMDAQGIDVEALSINPIFWYKAEHDLAAQVVKLQNEKLAEICAQYKDRFVGLGSVALRHPDLAAEQLEDAVKRLGLRGTLIGGSVNDEELSDPRFYPFWAKAEQLDAVVFIHPQGIPELAGRLKGNGVLANVIGNPLETTIALSHLIFEGTLDRFPGIKILAAHGGGHLPSYIGRSDAGCVTFPDRCTRPAEVEAQSIFAAALLRFDGVHAGGTPPFGCRGRRKSDRYGYRLPVPLDQNRGRSNPRHAWPQRWRPHRDLGRKRSSAPDDFGVEEVCRSILLSRPAEKRNRGCSREY